jgi:hypothetical protein
MALHGDQLTRSHSPCSNSQRAHQGKTMQRSTNPLRGRVHTASREGPSSDSAAEAVRAPGNSVPTCLYGACSAT